MGGHSFFNASTKVLKDICCLSQPEKIILSGTKGIQRKFLSKMYVIPDENSGQNSTHAKVFL